MATNSPRAMARSTPANARNVWILKAGRPQEVPVTLGVTDGKLTQIVKGELSADDDVITASRQSGR